MTSTGWLGTLAGTLTTVAFVPQVLQIWRTKCARDISLLMFGIFSVGVMFWLVYGIAMGALPIILFNAVTLILAVAVLAMKLRYRN